MPLDYRRFLSAVLLAIFASISILGDGLHLLTPEGAQHRHHYHGVYLVAHSRHASGHRNHVVERGHVLTTAVVAARKPAPLNEIAFANSNDVDWHVCTICAFLDEAVSARVEVSAPFELQPLVVALVTLPQHVTTANVLGPQAARGPPFLS
jgi:hypothetical protein